MCKGLSRSTLYPWQQSADASSSWHNVEHKLHLMTMLRHSSLYLSMPSFSTSSRDLMPAVHTTLVMFRVNTRRAVHVSLW